MRIRKRSGALFTSSCSWERTRRSSSSIAVSTDNGNGEEEEEFLLPLVAAAMDVQQDEEESGDHGTRATALGTHRRPAHNWRNGLELQRSGEGNTNGQVLEDGGEGKKVDGRSCNRCMGNQWDKIKLYTKEGTQAGALLVKEDTSSSAEKERAGGRDEEWKLPKPGQLVDLAGTSWRQHKNLIVHSVKRKRSKNEIGYIKGWKDDETTATKKIRQETYILQEDGRKVKGKAMPNKHDNSNNEAEGTRCRRRNGRGWRCSQRTLVGYSLCEHHLGKSRLKNITRNNNKGTTVAVNKKAGTCKFKELSLIDASLSCNVQVNPDQEKTNSGMNYKSCFELAGS